MVKTRIRIARRITAVIAVVLGIALTGFSETVTNVRGSQRENSKLVDIYYDLNATDGGTYYVEVEVVGKTSGVNASSFSGDVGEGISSGQNRRIVWDAGADWPGSKGDVMVVVKATKEDEGRPKEVRLWADGPYWADRNIGADNPWDYGLYFWWGDTRGIRNFNYSTYFNTNNSAIFTGGDSMSELQSSGWVMSDGVLAPSHDTAHVKWEGGWRMPTEQELSDLNNKCDWNWTNTNGVNGYVVHGKGAYASKSIFLPCAGRGDGTSVDSILVLANSYGYYWSSVPSSDSSRPYCAWCLFFGSSDHSTRIFRRNNGMSVRPVKEISNGGTETDSATTGSSEWFFVDTTDKPDVIVHFNANGGVFRDKDGDEVTKFDQHFTYGEAQRLFTDELTPMKMDANGNANHFLGWVRGSPTIESSAYLVDNLIDGRAMKTWDDDVSEVTFYAVWTATMTISYYNQPNKILSPSSLSNYLTWSAYDHSPESPKTGKSGEPVQIWPGTPNIYLLIDDDYKWVVGQIKFVGRYGVANPYYDSSICALHNIEIRGGQEYSIDVEVGPNQETPSEGEVVFWHSCAVMEELRNLINSQRGNLPDFDPTKVRITIGRVEFNPAGNDYVPAKIGGLTGLELNKFYWLPVGRYYLKDVTYDTDTSNGDPYWGAVLGPISARLTENRLIQLRNGYNDVITEYTINFDVFGGDRAVRVELNPNGGECAKTEMWFTHAGTGGVYPGKTRIDKKLPTPEERADIKFTGWFTTPTGSEGRKMEEGDVLEGDCTLFARWTNMKDYWMLLFPELAAASGGDIVTAANMTAANGCRTVGECYALGINPEDPNDDLKITDFEMKDGKPVITLNHTEDGSGNSFMPRVKTLGKATLSNTEEWREVPEEGDPTMRFFKVEVEMP